MPGHGEDEEKDTTPSSSVVQAFSCAGRDAPVSPATSTAVASHCVGR